MIRTTLSELGATGAQLLTAGVATVAVYLVVIVATRTAGLRSFSKMSAFDFAMTVAIGSLVASTASGQASLATTVLAVATLYLAQAGIARLRSHGRLGGAVDNTPLLLMDGSEILHENLARARVTVDDLHARLREANVLRYEQVQAVVLETTGDVSVLHGEGHLQSELLGGVRRA